MSNVTQMVPAMVILVIQHLNVHHKPRFSRYLYIVYIFNLKFYFEKHVHFNKLTKATHARHLGLQVRIVLVNKP